MNTSEIQAGADQQQILPTIKQDLNKGFLLARISSNKNSCGRGVDGDEPDEDVCNEEADQHQQARDRVVCEHHLQFGHKKIGHKKICPNKYDCKIIFSEWSNSAGQRWGCSQTTLTDYCCSFNSGQSPGRFPLVRHQHLVELGETQVDFSQSTSSTTGTPRTALPSDVCQFKMEQSIFFVIIATKSF